MYKKDYGGERFKDTFFALVMERGVNAAVGLIGMVALGGSGAVIPRGDIFVSGVSQILAMAASNEALRFVSYPTQVLGKSCKMVPVMVGGIALGGKKYPAIKYVQVVLVTVGVVVFNFGKEKKAGGDSSDSGYGLGLIVASLLLDAVTGGLQDKVKARTKELNPPRPGLKAEVKPTMHESMFWTNFSGFLVATLLALLTGHMQSGLAFCGRSPEVLRAILIYSMASAVGQNFIYFTITEFGPLVLSTVTTTRKIFSTVYSVIRNPDNSLANMQWAGCGLVFIGLAVDIGEKLVIKLMGPPKAVKAPGKKAGSKKKD